VGSGVQVGRQASGERADEKGVKKKVGTRRVGWYGVG